MKKIETFDDVTMDNFEKYHQLRNTLEPMQALHVMLEDKAYEDMMKDIEKKKTKKL